MKAFRKRYLRTCVLLLLCGLLNGALILVICRCAALRQTSPYRLYDGVSRSFTLHTENAIFSEQLWKDAIEAEVFKNTLLLQEYGGFPEMVRIVGGNLAAEPTLDTLWKSSFFTDGVSRATVGELVFLPEEDAALSIGGVKHKILGTHLSQTSVRCRSAIFYASGTSLCKNYAQPFVMVARDKYALNKEYAALRAFFTPLGVSLRTIETSAITTAGYFGVDGVLIALVLVCAPLSALATATGLRYWIRGYRGLFFAAYLIGYLPQDTIRSICWQACAVISAGVAVSTFIVALLCTKPGTTLPVITAAFYWVTSVFLCVLISRKEVLYFTRAVAA